MQTNCDNLGVRLQGQAASAGGWCSPYGRRQTRGGSRQGNNFVISMMRKERGPDLSSRLLITERAGPYGLK